MVERAGERAGGSPVPERGIAQQYEIVDARSVTQHPKNARRGNVAAIRESIAANGFYGALIVQRATRHILVGNHRWQAAVEMGFERLPAIFVDVDERAAEKLLLVDNKSSDDAAYSDAALAELLRSYADADDLSGTGYSREDVDAIIKRATAPAEFPEYGADITVTHKCPRCAYEWSK